MKKYIVIVLSSALMMACSQEASKKIGGFTGEVGENADQLQNITDTSECFGSSPSRGIEGRWMMSQRQGEIRMDFTLDVMRGFVQLSNRCTIRGRSLRATTTSEASYDNQYLVTYSHNEDIETINEPGFNMDCRVAIQPFRMRYSFQGRCLVLHDDSTGERMMWVPSW